jgi:hypothetical protein
MAYHYSNGQRTAALGWAQDGWLTWTALSDDKLMLHLKDTSGQPRRSLYWTLGEVIHQDCYQPEPRDILQTLLTAVAPASATDMASTSTAVSSTAVASDSSRAQAEARAAVLASLESAGSNYDSQLRGRAADLHSNAKSISKQEAEIRKQTAALAKENAKWQKELDKATKGLNQHGDLQNWAEMMERDFLVLEETLRLVEGGNEIDSASGGSQWR